ncbi:MAG: hypothetical protein VW600_17745 [Ferrovibrio sp.]
MRCQAPLASGDDNGKEADADDAGSGIGSATPEQQQRREQGKQNLVDAP